MTAGVAPCSRQQKKCLENLLLFKTACPFGEENVEYFVQREDPTRAGPAFSDNFSSWR